MALICSKQLLSAALRDILPATVSRSTLPILASVLIKNNKDNTISVLATNLEYSISLTVEAEETNFQDFVIEARFLQSWLSNQVLDKITINVKDDHVILQSGKSKTKINILDSDDFPQITSLPNKLELISVDNLSTALTQVALATSTQPSETRQYTRGVYATIKDAKIYLTGMNGIYMINRVVKIPETEDRGIGIIPTRCISTLTKLLPNTLKNLSIGIEPEKAISFTFVTKLYKLVEFKTQLINVPYPNYSRLLPQTYDIMITFDREELLRSINMGMLFAVDDVERIYFEFDTFGLKIHTQSNTRGEYDDYLTAITVAGGLGNSFILNGTVVTSWLRSQDSKSIQFECRNGNRNPVILRDAENVDGGFMLLLPMVLRDE